MESENSMAEYSVFKFLRHLPIPEALKVPVPGLEIFSMKIPMPDVLERSFSFKDIFNQNEKRRRYKKSTLPVRGLKKEETPPTSLLCGHVSGPLAKGFQTNFSVNGQDIALSEETWIFGELRLGVLVQVHGNEHQAGIMKAQKIIVL